MADSPANPLVMRESDVAKKTSGTSGPSSGELFALLIPSTSSVKTLPAFCPPVSSHDVHTLAYVAGLVDGDGSIWLQKGRTTQVYPALTIRLGWKGEETLRWLQRAFGGGFGKEHREPNPKHSEVFWWTVRAQDAASVLAMIYPHLRVKTAQAAVALHCWHLWNTESRQRRFLTCSRLKALMGVLNKTGEKIALPVVGRWLLVPTVEPGATPSLRFLKTWPRAGVMRSGALYARPTWAPRTDASGSSSSRGGPWPTPTVTGNHNVKGLSPTSGDGLATAMKNWATPRAEDGERGQGSTFDGLPEDVRAWATPTADDANNVTRASGAMQSLARDTNQWATPQAHDAQGGKTSEQVQAMRERTGAGVSNLNERTVAWATPAAQDGKNASTPPSQDTRDTLPGNVGAWAHGTMPSPSEATTAPSDSSPAKPRRPGLNPRFTLWLMGFPVAWLDSVPLATRSSRRAPKSSGDDSSK